MAHLRYLITLFLIFFSMVFLTSCSKSNEKPVTCSLSITGTTQGALMDITGATILFEDLSFNGSYNDEITLFDPDTDGADDPYGLRQSVSGRSMPKKAGRPKIGVSFWSRDQRCEIKFGKHEINITNQGKNITIDQYKFDLDPSLKSKFTVSIVDGKTFVAQN
ncbi:MAG: hypothetical protein ACSHX6_02860 [Akkermansiaceae bacterium]